MEEKGIHNGHRQRVKADFLKNGYDENTSPEKVLEHLLFYCIPRRDTVPVAKELLNTFGSLSAVFTLRGGSLCARLCAFSERGLYVRSLPNATPP